MIEFRDVEGQVTKVPGKHFFKLDNISDEAIAEYISRGAELVDINRISHASAVKIRTSKARLAAEQELEKVATKEEMEDPGVTAVRTSRQATADKATEADEVAGEALAQAKTTKAAKPKVGRPKRKGKKND